MSLAKRSEKGLLTPDNCVVALIDHQPQMLFGITASIVKPLREFKGQVLQSYMAPMVLVWQFIRNNPTQMRCIPHKYL
jgi:hypothetical protein